MSRKRGDRSARRLPRRHRILMAELDRIRVVETTVEIRIRVPRHTLQGMIGTSGLNGGKSCSEGALALIRRAECTISTRTISTAQCSSMSCCRCGLAVATIAVHCLRFRSEGWCTTPIASNVRFPSLSRAIGERAIASRTWDGELSVSAACLRMTRLLQMS